MFFKIAMVAVAVLSTLNSTASAQELANSRKHNWSKIAYPSIECNWGNKELYPSIAMKTKRQGFEFELLIRGPKEKTKKTFDVPNSSDFKVRLHSADGRIRTPMSDFVVSKDWNRDTEEWNTRATCSFAWTRNEFDEAFIELRFDDKLYYFELPYGFTRDPRAELCLPSSKNFPQLVDSIQPIEHGANVIWWHHVEYDFGEIEPGWQLLFWVSNPFDMHCDVVIRPLTKKPRTLPRHLKQIEVKLTQSGHRKLVAKQRLGRLYPPPYENLSDQLPANFNRNPNHGGRQWGEFELSFADRQLKAVAPSSLFNYVHGVADYYREAERFSTHYGPHSVDSRLPFYRPLRDRIDASIRIGGSEMSLFLFSELDDLLPGLKIKSDFRGDNTAIDYLIEGTADLVFLKRQLTNAEIVKFKKKFGQPPIPITIAMNRVGIFVNEQNPLSRRGISIAEADAIFSTTRNQGYKNEINRWGDLGLKGDWADKPIHLYATWGDGVTMIPAGESTLFQRRVIKNGKFKEFRDISQRMASGKLTSDRWRRYQRVGLDDRYGIGFGVIRQKIDFVKAVPLGRPPVLPTAGNCYRGDYPLTEKVCIVVSPSHFRSGSTEVTNPAIREILKFALSRQGQAEFWQDSYLPLPYDLAKKSAKKMNLDLPIRQAHLNSPAAIAGILSKTHSQDDLEALVLDLSAPIYARDTLSVRSERLIKQWQRSKNFEPLIETVEFFGESCAAVSAAKSLVKLGRKQYWANLKTYSKHRHKRMRNWVVRELRNVPESESIEILIDMISDSAQVTVAPRTTVGDDAHEALRFLTDQDFEKDKSQWQSWWESIGKKEFSKLRH